MAISNLHTHGMAYLSSKSKRQIDSDYLYHNLWMGRSEGECTVCLSSIRGRDLVCVCGQTFERLGRNGCCWPVISQRLINLGNLGWCPLTAVAPKRLGNSLNAKPVTVELHIRHCRWRKSLIFRDGSGLHLQHSKFLTVCDCCWNYPLTQSLAILQRTQIIKQHDPH